MVRALDWRSKGRGFESHQEHKSQKGCADSLSVCPTPVSIHTHTKDHVRTLKIHDREFGGLWKYEKITSLHLYPPPKRRNVAAQMAEELKTVIRYPSYGGTQKKGKEKIPPAMRPTLLRQMDMASLTCTHTFGCAPYTSRGISRKQVCMRVDSEG